ncbi:zinc finger protein 106 [Stigmatopora argus]
MTRDRKCILCETVHASKQEMDEHMRSMLHHRELEKLKGRDCGHDCRVCRVSLVSLTEYAGHISSPAHKQNVEKEKNAPRGDSRHQDYFDHNVVELIHKRKEKLRKEKEAATAAKLAKEAEETKKRSILQRIKEANERKQLEQGGLPFSNGRSWNSQYYSWNRSQEQIPNGPNGPNGAPWNNKSASWHAQAPPNLQRRGSHESNPGRMPWLSNQGSNYGFYGRNNLSQFSLNNRPDQGSFQRYPPPPRLFATPVSNHNPKTPSEGTPASKRNPKLAETSRSCPSLDGKTGSRSKLTEKTPKEPGKQEKAAEAPTSTEQGTKKALRNQHKNDIPSKSHEELHPQPHNRGTKTPPIVAPPPQTTPKLPRSSKKSSGRRSSSDFSRPATPPQAEPRNDRASVPTTENGRHRNAPKTKSGDRAREKLTASSAESIDSLQSLHVSTSTSKKFKRAAPKPHERVKDTTDAKDRGSEGEPPRSDKGCPNVAELDLPPVLKRDLTKRIGSKTGGHEPNLHHARRIRNLSELRRSDGEKDSGIKPTVRQLISSAGSRRKVNWDQVYQEVRKKQDKGKGMPRFGIEMVSNEDHSQEENDLATLENFPWESLIESATPAASSRKRSLSESSLAPPTEASPRRASVARESAGRRMSDLAVEEAQKRADQLMREKIQTPRTFGGNGAEEEQVDGQGTAKRRRTPGDVLSLDSSSVEQDVKRRKTKSKTDRVHIDQLLAVSLREEELSRSLQAADVNLVQAQAALDAAYVEVQRVMVVKQQITTELSSLREKRISLLKGMQAGNPNVAEIPPIGPKQEPTDGAEAEDSASNPPPSVQSNPAPAPSTPPPPAFSATVKEEPLSPVHIACESEPGEKFTLPEPTLKMEDATFTEKSVQATFRDEFLPDVKPAAAADRSPSPPSETPRAADGSEARGGKRVRRLKKRKVLEKAHGSPPPESSDTEMDAKPRWPRTQRRASGGSGVGSGGGGGSSQVSTSGMPPGRRAEMEEGGEDLKMAARPEASIPDRSESDKPTVACNEVTSTSDMDVCRSSESEMSLPRISWSPSCPSTGVFEGHQEAVNGMQIHNGLLYTCSGDRTVKAFDLLSRRCVAVFSGHASKVSCLLVSAAPCLQHRLYTGSSDQTIRCYSLRTQELEQQFNLADRVLCLHNRWNFLYAGLANGTVVTFDLTSNKQRDAFECHVPRAVSCLASSREGSRRILLAGSHDSTISVRDAKTGLLLRTLGGHAKTVLCMKVVNDLVFSGSSDQCVYAHNILTGELVHVYEGHSHAVTVVTVIGKVMVTACLDKQVRIYDLQSRELLQVYAGHSDMVTSMAVHQSQIYTGCYDGSVQTFDFNLMQNYRCKWHGCSLAFGVPAHLQQHALADHVANQPTPRCSWKNCEQVFCPRDASKQAALAHVQRHADEARAEP